MKPYINDTDFRLYVGDVRQVLAELPAESVDCCVTSPPYWGLRDYGTDGQIGLEATPEQFVAEMVDVFRQVRRVLAPHGTLWLNLGDSYAGGGPNRPSDKRALATATQDGDRLPPLGLKPKDLVGIPWRVAFALQQPYYTGTIRNELDRVWLAAMIDAEGCIYVHRRKAGQSNGQGYERKNDTYGSGLEISNTSLALIERVMEIAGRGSISSVDKGSDSRRRQTLYRWNLRTNECRDVLREVYPYLIAKRQQARIAIGCPSSGERATAAHEALKGLHRGSDTDVDFAEPESMFEPGWYLRADNIWSKPNPMPESVTDRPTKAHEYVFLLSKQPRYFFDQEAVREPSQPSSIERMKSGWNGNEHRGHPNGGHDNISKYIGTERGMEKALAGRNVRSVWEIATQPYPDAHFATFPEALPERCIKAGCPVRVCVTCGKPSERIVESEAIHASWEDRKAAGATSGNREVGSHYTPHAKGVSSNLSTQRTTVGWSDCGHDNWRTGVVLDPFMGSGTTALVARRNGRHAVGVELNPEYAELCARRTRQLSLLADAA